MLAAPLLKANTTVPVPQLIDALWDESPPAHARTVVQGHVSRLRALPAAAGAAEHGAGLLTQGPPYVFEVPEELLDPTQLSRFPQVSHLGTRAQRADGSRHHCQCDALAQVGEEEP